MRKWHRWIGLGAVVFLLSVGITGVILQFQQFFGADEAAREKLASLTSAYSVSSGLGDFVPKLAKAQASVALQAGDAKLDNVEMQLKGEHPTFIFHTSGKANRKYVVNADTAAIEKSDDDERESFLLRLHTGEVFGDGGVVLGMFWGTALLVLCVTGLYLYWQMYSARARVKGWKKIFWMLPLSLLIPQRAFAGSPFQTDDPGFVAHGWEIKTDSTYERNVNADILTAPILDVNYTIVEHFKLDLILAEKTVSPSGGGDAHTGLADTDFRFKWRFLDEKPDSWIPALSIAPNITFPTASKSRGLGDGIWRARLPMQIGKTFDKLYVYGELGYQWALSERGEDQVIYGLAAQYQLTEHWNIGAEIFGTDLFGVAGDSSAIANIGAVYTFNDHVQFQAAIGRTLRDEDRGGPEVLVRVLLQFNF